MIRPQTMTPEAEAAVEQKPQVIDSLYKGYLKVTMKDGSVIDGECNGKVYAGFQYVGDYGKSIKVAISDVASFTTHYMMKEHKTFTIGQIVEKIKNV